MPPPTESGYHWWKASPRAEPEVVQVIQVLDDAVMDGGLVARVGTYHLASMDELGGEWGERVPDCPWLRAQETPHAPTT